MRVVIAEDSAVVRAGLAEILADRGHEVVAAVGDGEALLAAVAEHQPDVTVVDVRMPPGYTDEGLRAAIAIRRDHPETGVLVFSQYVETRYAADLLRSAPGASHRRAAGVGYLTARLRRLHVLDEFGGEPGHFGYPAGLVGNKISCLRLLPNVGDIAIQMTTEQGFAAITHRRSVVMCRAVSAWPPCVAVMSRASHKALPPPRQSKPNARPGCKAPPARSS